MDLALLIEKSHFKGVFGCIFRQSLMKYGGNKSIKENSLRLWVLIPEDNRHSTVTWKIPLFSVEPVTISYTHYWVRWVLPLKITWTGIFFVIFIVSLNISHFCLYQWTKIKSSYIIWRIYHCHFVRFCMTFWIYIHVRKRNEKWILRSCNFLIKKKCS
jgi:hypothetical protein